MFSVGEADVLFDAFVIGLAHGKDIDSLHEDEAARMRNIVIYFGHQRRLDVPRLTKKDAFHIASYSVKLFQCLDID